MSTPGLTPSQTVGPFFHDALLRRDAVVATVVPMDTAGSRVRIHGTMIDGAGEGVPDAMLSAAVVSIMIARSPLPTSSTS